VQYCTISVFNYYLWLCG